MIHTRYPDKIACAYLYPITRYGYPPDIRQTISHISEMAALGFSSLELEGIGEENIHYLYKHSSDIADALANAGCKVPVLCVVLPQLGAVDAAERTRSLEYFEMGCEVARSLGAQAVLDNGPLLPLGYPRQTPIRRHYGEEQLAALSLPPTFSWYKYWHALVATFQEACGIAQRYQLTYDLHPCEGSLITDTDSFTLFATAVDRPNLLFNLDTANQFYFRDNLPLSVHRLVGKTRYIHLSDNTGSRVEHLVPGDGRIQWDAFFSALRDINFQGNFALDIGGAETPISDLQAAYGRAARWLQEKLETYSLN
ncbi:MAG: sugar phosphate isomerase/epimerase [Chitinophagaceae bacterium]|nr:sugar phosphate isomerase/epimerase [Chitinophagaceae bacterium]